jgi:hypothetical protein
MAKWIVQQRMHGYNDALCRLIVVGTSHLGGYSSSSSSLIKGASQFFDNTAQLFVTEPSRF